MQGGEKTSPLFYFILHANNHQSSIQSPTNLHLFQFPNVLIATTSVCPTKSFSESAQREHTHVPSFRNDDDDPVAGTRTMAANCGLFAEHSQQNLFSDLHFTALIRAETSIMVTMMDGGGDFE